MKFNSALILTIISVVFISGCAQYGGGTAQPTAQATSTTGNTVEITPSGFSPKTLTVNAGDTVTFINKNARSHWPASDVHPTHTVYPGSGIEKCRTGANVFDSCRGLKQGETFSFTFNEVGVWRYHDHLNPALTGVIEVR